MTMWTADDRRGESGLRPPCSDGSGDLAMLLRRAAAGDERAFSALYDATASRVFGLAARLLRSSAQAVAVAQDSYVEIWRTAARFDPERGDAGAWIMATVHARAVRRMRADDQGTARDVARYSSIESSRARDLLAEIPADQREALNLTYFEGLTHAEVATLTKVSVSTVDFRLRNGLMRLRDLVKR